MVSLVHWFRATVLLGTGIAASLLTALPATAQETVDQPKTPAKLMAPEETPATPCEAAPSAWLTNPPYRTYPRTGFFGILPSGCGYYSLADHIAGEERPAPPKFGYIPNAFMGPPFYDADFRYVDDPKYNPDFLEELHRIHFGDNWLFATGGEFRWREVHEFNSRLTGKTNQFDLLRIRMFGDVWYKDTFRIYAELISAQPLNNDLAPLRTDEDRIDFQNLFFDLKVGEIDGKPVYVRAGRQELLFGSQRLISPPDWSNTRRTFEGVRGFWASEKLDIDLFWVQPVLPNNSGWSSIDHFQNFYGAWITYRPEKKQVFDLYYLFLDNANHTTTLGLNLAPTSLHTLGTRYSGDKDGFLWDFEGMLQLGHRGGEPITAGCATAGLGYNAKCLPMNPVVWAYYDWASGDHSPNSGHYTTFNQLFPTGHYYFGALDLVGRQNIRDWNGHLYLYPTKWLTFNLQYHFFSLDSATDALYNAAGTPIRANLKGAAGGTVGQELDLLANFHLTKRSDFVVGYSKLNAGNFIDNTGPSRSPELFYVMYNVRW